MTSQAEKRRRKKRAVQNQKAQQGPNPNMGGDMTPRRPKKAHSNRPTPQRAAQGVWSKPNGPGKQHQPYVDMASDMIGVLHQSKQITDAQEQAARTFQSLYAAYVAELEVPGYKSCLAGSVGGYDSGDGSPEVIAAYRSLESAIGRIKIAVLKVEVSKGAHERTHSLGALRRALDAVAGIA